MDFFAEKASLLQWPSQASPKIVTQRKVNGRSQERVDLALEGETQAIWIEAKLDSGEGKDQLLSYSRWLSQAVGGQLLGSNGLLVYLTRQGRSRSRIVELVESTEFQATGIRAVAADWMEVSEWFADNGGLLAESFSHYLEKEYVLVKPIAAADNEDLEVLDRADRTRESWWQLYDGVRESLSRSWRHSTEVSWPKQQTWRGCPMFNLNFMPHKEQDPKWPRDRSTRHAWLELRLPDPRSELAFRCGVTLVDPVDLRASDWFDSGTLDPVRTALERVGGPVAETRSGENGWLARLEVTCPAENLPESSIDGQIEALAEWTDRVFSAVPLEAVRPLPDPS